MKTKKFWAIALGAMTGCAVFMGMVGCSQDPSEQIIGTWQRTAKRVIYPDQDVYMPMRGCMGCDVRTFTFKKDNTGMVVSHWIGASGESCADTMRFTYTIDGDNGVITRVSDNQTIDWSHSYFIQDITAKQLTILDSVDVEYSTHSASDFNGYVVAEKIYHYCEKK